MRNAVRINGGGLSEEKWLRMTEKSHLIDKKRLWTMAIEGAAVMRKMGC